MVRFGIALGGGGAKGLAHVLMLEALDEIGLRPVCVAGTSIGAVIGVLYCCGKSGREIREWMLQMVPRTDVSQKNGGSFKHYFRWLDLITPQFGGGGLLKTERFISLLFDSIKANSFDQLAIPLRVATAEFWSREEVVLDRGPLRQAVQASMSLPGFSPPVVMDGRVLIDGGAVNPVPFDLLPSDCTLTAAVDAIGRRERLPAQLPSIPEAIFNTFQIMEKSIVRAKLSSARPDIYVEIEATVRLLEFHKAVQVLDQATRTKDDFKRELENRLVEQK